MCIHQTTRIELNVFTSRAAAWSSGTLACSCCCWQVRLLFIFQSNTYVNIKFRLSLDIFGDLSHFFIFLPAAKWHGWSGGTGNGEIEDEESISFF